MPPIFYLQAYEAAAGRAPAVAAFEKWEELAKALDKLTPEQRCDAVYADCARGNSKRRRTSLANSFLN